MWLKFTCKVLQSFAKLFEANQKILQSLNSLKGTAGVVKLVYTTDSKSVAWTA